MRSGTRTTIMDKIGAIIIGIFLIIIGILLIRSNNEALNEYKNSSDKQTVIAEIKDVHVTTETRRSGGRHSSTRRVKKYECTLEYTVNDNVVRYRHTYYDEKSVGEKITLNIYKDNYGNYQIARFTSEEDKNNGNLISYIMIGFGVFALIYGVLIKLDTSLN